MEGGAQCAMTDGTSEMLKLCANNLGIMDVSIYLPNFTATFIGISFLLASYSLLSPSSNSDPLYVLDDVHCIGTETKLSDCSHSGVGVNDCHSGEAGVICTSKLVVNVFKKRRECLFQKMSHVRKEQSTWWEVMMCLEEEFSTATMEPGILCALITGTPLEWRPKCSVKVLDIILLIMVNHRLT